MSRKTLSNESLARVLEYTVTELQADLKTYQEKEYKLLNSHVNYIDKKMEEPLTIDTSKMEKLIDKLDTITDKFIQASDYNQSARKVLSWLFMFFIGGAAFFGFAVYFLLTRN